jgi:hypothetical protein
MPIPRVTKGRSARQRVTIVSTHIILDTEAHVENSPHEKMAPDKFINDLDQNYRYLLARGAAFIMSDYRAFVTMYNAAWREQSNHQAAVTTVPGVLAQASSYRLVSILLRARWIPNDRKQLVIFILVIPLLILSGSSSAYGIIRNGISRVPPLITAVVIVFVTGDAWRILGNGFTPGLIVLWVVLIMVSMLLLIHIDYWTDIDVSEAEAIDLLQPIEQATRVHDFIKMGASPSPIKRPATLAGRQFVYFNYLMFSFLSLIGVALSVTVALLIVGMILISAHETDVLAHSVQIYWTLPGHVVITRQLLSLSLTLGVFAAFFLVVGQHAEGRERFMNDVLRDLRQFLLVYSVYCRAQEKAAEWTGVVFESPPLDQGAQ